jgi:hypothetical protein
MLSVPSGPWPPRLMMDDEINLWPESSSPSESFLTNMSEPFVAERSDPTDCMNPSHSGPSTEAMPISVSKTSENDCQLYRGSGSPLSQGVLYNDVIHKFGSVLAMCEFDQVVDLDQSRAKLTGYL